MNTKKSSINFSNDHYIQSFDHFVKQSKLTPSIDTKAKPNQDRLVIAEAFEYSSLFEHFEISMSDDGWVCLDLICKKTGAVITTELPAETITNSSFIGWLKASSSL